MNPCRRTIPSLLALAIAVAAVAGCERSTSGPGSPGSGEEASGPDPESTEALPDEPTIQLVEVRRDAGRVTVDLHYTPSDDMAGPREAELWLGHSPSLSYASSEPLEAAEAAGKDVHVQERDGKLRTVLLATNVTRIREGPLVRYHFEHTGGEPAKVWLLERMPIFAPREANRGLHLPEPLVIGDE